VLLFEASPQCYRRESLNLVFRLEGGIGDKNLPVIRIKLSFIRRLFEILGEYVSCFYPNAIYCDVKGILNPNFRPFSFELKKKRFFKMNFDLGFKVL